MQIVIDISDKDYNNIEPFLNGETINGGFNLFKVLEIIRNGTPLPKGHGRLIDKTKLSDHIKNRLIQTAMNNMETILPYSEVCTDIVDNRIDIWIDEVKTIIEGSDSECMAIKALEQEQSEDCISREAVRRILANQRDELVKLHTVNPKDNPKADAMAYGVNWSLNTLMELPSVTPKAEAEAYNKGYTDAMRDIGDI